MENKNKYYKIVPNRIDYKGVRFFKFNYDSIKVIQVCLSSGEGRRGKSNTIGIHCIDRLYFFSNYLAMNYAIQCTRKEYKVNFDKIVKLLKE